ncbi:MAG TPA: enoyl-CoA hydratase/isomerase family protein [Deltaproteobacteria bacterium]|nr:enoyl-CoA hydratase/isomerase family protein [Deltaproteobacteria bacterium]
MAVIEWENLEEIAQIRMNNGENRHNLVFAETMIHVLNEVLIDERIHGVVLSSTDTTCWSLGMDVDWLFEQYAKGEFDLIKKCLYAVNEMFKTMLTFPIPLIACINGHVAANGLVLACACDFRFMSIEQGFCRFPEVDLGIPFLPGMIEIAKKGIPFHTLEELKYTGEKINAQEMEEHNIILKALETKQELFEESMRFARSLNKKRSVFGEMKRRMNRWIIKAIDEEDPLYIEPLNLTA